MPTRRTVLTAAAAALPVLLGSPSLFAAEPPAVKKRNALVLVFCRGGADGLNLVVPFADPKYAELRKALAIPAPGQPGGALDLDGRFGLHPTLAPLQRWFADGTMTAIHAVAHPGNTRSHFEEQDTWECAETKHLGETGWIGRCLAATAAGSQSPVRALALGGGMPRALRGPAGVAVADGLDALPLPGPGMGEALEQLSASATPAMGDAAAMGSGMGSRNDGARLLAKGSREAIAAAEALRRITPDKDRPSDPFARRCADAAAVLRSDLGVEAIEVDLDGWDTHQQQGTGEGPFADHCRSLGLGLDALLSRLDGELDRTVVAVMTEFGRTAAINGTAGTDHGWGGALLLAGGPIRRIRKQPVNGTWPGLSDLQDGRDLRHTTDFRDVVGAIAEHLGANPTTVIPGHQTKALPFA